MEAEKLNVLDVMYDRRGNLRRHISDQTLTEEEVESRLFEVIDEYADCIVAAARLQAHVQQLPLEIGLLAIWTHSEEDTYAEVSEQIDIEALAQRMSVCAIQMSRRLRE